ncbi:disease resistance response protein 206-like [Coffea eugenioides]|uniref:Dirigent protein n=1 Tax=Coffea arabica TaxID=13443 RepID=A0A6P6WMX7_COFAR|nr:disease resistance response protein 206-like [Coffea arabica]XP_027158917.1 disease resistance response protein 206-like [Coffea eugenioides]
MAVRPLILALFLCLLLSIFTTSHGYKTHRRGRPCKELSFYFHDILYKGHNKDNATSAIVGAPDWGNRTEFARPFDFGDLVVFDDPITLDNNLHSTPVGRAQGMYVYDQLNAFSAWLSFSFVFNSTQHKGSLNFAGPDPILNQTRIVSITSGTGDFFMARGIAILTTDAYEGNYYFRLRVDIKLHECWE